MVVTWFLVILFCLIMYIVFDGYDLGIGTATLLESDRGRRRHMIELVATGWDGNETWLILLGVSLWAGFPLAWGVILPHLYLPLIVTLFALIVRGVSVELTSQSDKPHPGWGWAFGLASLVASFGQGFSLGMLAEPAIVHGGAYAGESGGFPWFAILMGATVTIAYLALGYAYLKLKGEGELRRRAATRGNVSALIAVVFGVASLVAINGTAAPLNLSDGLRAWSFWALLLFGVAGAALTALTFGRVRGNHLVDSMPFTGLVIATVAVFLAFTVSHYPVLVPPSLTVQDSAGPDGSLSFLLIGVGFNLPLVVFYHWFAHRTFGGKFRLPNESSADAAPAAAVTTGVKQ
jgi:cytochrome d ubiquinol oxidase subunit II